MTPIWQSNLSVKLKKKLTASLEKDIYVAYTRMLRVAINKRWQDHMSNIELYGNIPKITIIIREHKIGFLGTLLTKQIRNDQRSASMGTFTRATKTWMAVEDVYCTI